MKEGMEEELTREINEEIDRLLENEEVLEEFERVFPKEVVRADPRERPFEVTEENLEKMFDILNRMFFENKLKKVPLLGMTFDEAKTEVYKKRINDPIIDPNKARKDRGISGMEVLVDLDIHSIRIAPGSEFIYIQLIEDKRTSFGYILATLLHEMIHNYDSHYGDLLELYYRKLSTGFIYNNHETKVFRKYTKMANDKNIKVVKTIDANESYELSNEIAQKYLLDLPLGEVKFESKNEDGEEIDTTRFYKVGKNRFVVLCP